MVSFLRRGFWSTSRIPRLFLWRTDMKTDGFLLVSQAARELRCSATTIREMERTGRLKASRTPGGTRIFTRDDIQRLKAERETEAVMSHKKFWSRFVNQRFVNQGPQVMNRVDSGIRADTTSSARAGKITLEARAAATESSPQTGGARQWPSSSKLPIRRRRKNCR
jgi:excisionase family DNA binding protein